MGNDMKRKLFAVLLAALMLSTVFGIPAFAFSDLHEGRVSEAVKDLSALGIIGGYPDGTFRPDKTLNRAEFCKIAIYLLDAVKLIDQYAGYTIFADVPYGHWATSYINTAARHNFSGKEGGKGIIGGFPDGTFQPEEHITGAQAITIALRILGYQDSDVGPLWPQSYLAKAENLHITEGVSFEQNTPITRGNAAILFANLLDIEMKETGKTLFENFGYSYLEKVILLATEETDSQLKKGEIRYFQNGFATVAEVKGSISSDLVGKKGKLTIDKNKKIVSFAPDEGKKTSVLVGIARVDGIKSANDQLLYIPAKTPVITTDGVSKTYSECWTEIKRGSEYVVYYDERGNMDYLMEMSLGKDAALAILKSDGGNGKNPLNEVFSSVSAEASIIKNGQKVTENELRRYDVVYYNELTTTFVVTDRKLTGPLEDASPALLSTQNVTLYGIKFPVLEASARVFKDFKLGDRVTLLLTADGKVAGAVSADSIAASEYAIVKSLTAGSVKLEFMSGYETTLLTNSDYTSYITSGMVTVRPTGNGKVSLTDAGFSLSRSGRFDVKGKTVGTKKLAPGVRIFERATMRAMLKEVKLEDIEQNVIEGSGIWFTGENASGQIEVIVLANIIGDCYTYGKVTSKEVTGGGSGGMGGTVDTYWTYMLEGPTPVSGNSRSKISSTFTDAFGGLVTGFTGEGEIVSAIFLKPVGKATLADFSGKDYINVAGRPMKLSDSTVYYFEQSKTYGTLEKAKNMGETFTVYTEDTLSGGLKARLVVVS